MHTMLNDLPGTINRVFDLLELIVLRSTLLGLVVLGAHTVLRGWRKRGGKNCRPERLLTKSRRASGGRRMTTNVRCGAATHRACFRIPDGRDS